MDEMIQKQTLTDISVKQQTVEEIVEVAHSVPRIRGNESQSRSWTCPCRKEQTVEATKGIPYQRVSRRIVKQIVDQCHKWQEQNIKDSRNRATSCEHEDTIFSVSGQDPLNKLWNCEDGKIIKNTMQGEKPDPDNGMKVSQVVKQADTDAIVEGQP